MRKSGSRLSQWLFVAIMIITGCANNQQAYQKAFDSQHSLTHNQCTFTQPPESIFKIVKQILIQQGFTIESADSKSGIVKAVRNMPDKENPEISYNINTSVDISEVTESETNVSVAASQQTILHRATTTWWHLLWIIPIIPTGTEYQTLVIKEGNITEPGLYTDFFNSCRIAVTKYDLAVKTAAAKAAEKAEKIKADAEAKAAAEKAEAIRVAAENAAKIKADAEAKAAAEKAETIRVAAESAAKIEADAVQIANHDSGAANIQSAPLNQTGKAPAEAAETKSGTDQSVR